MGIPQGEKKRESKSIWRNNDWQLHNVNECINPHIQEAQQTSVKNHTVQKCTYCIVPFIWKACKKQICRQRKQISDCLALGVGAEIDWKRHGEMWGVM